MKKKKQTGQISAYLKKEYAGGKILKILPLGTVARVSIQKKCSIIWLLVYLDKSGHVTGKLEL